MATNQHFLTTAITGIRLRQMQAKFDEVFHKKNGDPCPTTILNMNCKILELLLAKPHGAIFHQYGKHMRKTVTNLHDAAIDMYFGKDCVSNIHGETTDRIKGHANTLKRSCRYRAMNSIVLAYAQLTKARDRFTASRFEKKRKVAELAEKANDFLLTTMRDNVDELIVLGLIAPTGWDEKVEEDDILACVAEMMA